MARAATAAQTNVERTLVASKAALREEKVARDCAERSLTNAQATIRDLQAKLDATAQALQMAQADLAAAKEKAVATANVVPQTDVAAGGDNAAPAAPRRAGRPREAVAGLPLKEAPEEAVTPVQATAAKKGSGRSGKLVKWWVKGQNKRW